MLTFIVLLVLFLLICGLDVTVYLLKSLAYVAGGLILLALLYLGG